VFWCLVEVQGVESPLSEDISPFQFPHSTDSEWLIHIANVWQGTRLPEFRWLF
jgi:hypothetical protein